MEAASGIIHSEIPVAEDPNELLHGFQLWVNLPAAHKMGRPRYQDIQADAIPASSIDSGRGTVRVLAGEWDGMVGPIKGVCVEHVQLRALPTDSITRARRSFVL